MAETGHPEQRVRPETSGGHQGTRRRVPSSSYRRGGCDAGCGFAPYASQLGAEGVVAVKT